MKQPIQTGMPTIIKERPIKFSGALKDFEDGVLCFVVARRHKGKGPVKLILHRACAYDKDSFGYGAFGAYVVSPGTLLSFSTSKQKALASRVNGLKGGRPRKPV